MAEHVKLHWETTLVTHCGLVGHLFVLQLKVCQYLHGSLLRVLDGLRLAAEEGVHLGLPLIVFGNADFKYLNALFRDVFLKRKCWGEGKRKQAMMFVKICHRRGCGAYKGQRSGKGYAWRRGATPGTHGISSASGSSFSMLFTRLEPFRCSTNASWTKKKSRRRPGNPLDARAHTHWKVKSTRWHFRDLLAIIPCAVCVAVCRRLRHPFAPRAPEARCPPERSDIWPGLHFSAHQLCVNENERKKKKSITR